MAESRGSAAGAERTTALRYAYGVLLCQVGWLGLVLLPEPSRPWGVPRDGDRGTVRAAVRREVQETPGIRITSPSGTACSRSSSSARRSPRPPWP
ncbi:hypothetical protein LT493_27765 [Streptomyces tricolor]|nr:hypothetical protein [Streptomyces tricolor]